MTEELYHLGVKALIRNKMGEVLLLKVNPDELKSYDREAFWDLPGGRVLRGSTVEETLKREVGEETGISDTGVVKPLVMVLSKLRIPVEGGDVGLVLWVFTCDAGEVGEIKISQEHLEWGWFTPGDAAKLLEVKYPGELTERVAGLG